MRGTEHSGRGYIVFSYWSAVIARLFYHFLSFRQPLFTTLRTKPPDYGHKRADYALLPPRRVFPFSVPAPLPPRHKSILRFPAVIFPLPDLRQSVAVISSWSLPPSLPAMRAGGVGGGAPHAQACAVRSSQRFP